MMKRVAFGTLMLMLVLALGLAAASREQMGGLKGSDLIGMKVQGTDGKNLVDIKDLVIDRDDGEIQYAVLDFGGFAGIGDKYFAVPWQALHFQDNNKIALDLHKKELKDAPGFDKNHWPDLSDQQVVIYDFYEVPAPHDEQTAQSMSER